jgi:trimethylamine--corrinoid protein Co-methyltransferase
MWEIAKTFRNDEAGLRRHPYVLHYAEPISPLKQAFEGLGKLLFCAETGIPVVYSPAPIAGSTAPITVAGHVAQGLAECFCGVVIHQLKQKGAPIIIGMGPAVLDMVTGECSYNAPEYGLSYMNVIEMSHFYNLPSWGYAGTSDSQIPDGQAMFEAGLMTFLSSLAGANLNHDVGYLDFGKTGSLQMMVITDEIIDQTRRLLRGVPVNEEHLALSVIHGIGPGGHFLTADHTLNHLRATQWRPTLISREGFEQWKASGGLILQERARERALRILKNHKRKPIDAEKALTLKKLVEGY